MKVFVCSLRQQQVLLAPTLRGKYCYNISHMKRFAQIRMWSKCIKRVFHESFTTCSCYSIRRPVILLVSRKHLSPNNYTSGAQISLGLIGVGMATHLPQWAWFEFNTMVRLSLHLSLEIIENRPPLKRALSY